MTCDEAREAFTDLYDGTLSGPPLTVLSRHLDGCRACRLEWAAFRKAIQALGDLRDEEPSPGFAARVVERIEGPTWWRRAIEAIVFPLRLKLPLHAAALILLGVVGVWIFQRSPELHQAVDLGVPASTERFASSPQTAPLPDKVAIEPRPKAGPIALPPAPPARAASPPPAAPAPAPFTAEKGGVSSGASIGQGAPQGLAAKDGASLPAAPPPAALAKKAEPEPAAARALRSTPDSEGSGAKMESALQAKPAGPKVEKKIAGSPAETADDLFSAAATEYALTRLPGRH